MQLGGTAVGILGLRVGAFRFRLLRLGRIWRRLLLRLRAAAGIAVRAYAVAAQCGIHCMRSCGIHSECAIALLRIGFLFTGRGDAVAGGGVIGLLRGGLDRGVDLRLCGGHCVLGLLLGLFLLLLGLLFCHFLGLLGLLPGSFGLGLQRRVQIRT